MATNAFSFKLGTFECLAVKDGDFTIPHKEIFADIPLPEVENLLKKHGYKPGEVPIELTCLLVRTGKGLVLVDTGFGPDFEPNVGKLIQNMRAAGINLSDISAVIHSHGHTDHVGGNVDLQGKPNFPRAQHFIMKDDFEFWANDQNLALLREGKFKQAQTKTMRNCILPVMERVNLVEQGAQILPGFKAIKAPGHTPGHTALEISSGVEKLLCIFDVAHYRFQLDQPEWVFHGDILSEIAVKTRCDISARASGEKVLVMACHFPFPGLGYIKENGHRSWLWQPIN
jgi:glyoxylase-like metal-dependent hydrolase (beta-lactamase superfamily II)